MLDVFAYGEYFGILDVQPLLQLQEMGALMIPVLGRRLRHGEVKQCVHLT